MTISGVIFTKNAENRIKECLKSLFFCNEIVIIDDNSTDNTENLVKLSKNTRFIRHSLSGDFSCQHNFGLSKATGDWILFVDDDEQVSPLLASEIETAMAGAEEINGFYLKRQDSIWGKTMKHGEHGTLKHLRLMRRGAGLWQGKVHERLFVKGKTRVLKHYLIHRPLTDLSSYLGKINFYTDLLAKEKLELGEKFSFFRLLCYPPAKFLQNYLWRLGFLDGNPGLIMGFMMSLHSLLVKAKMYPVNLDKNGQ
jgi:glycosyltransferase involved in cell wall biosynthesis